MNEISERGLITSVFPPSFSAFLLNFLTKDEMLLRGFSPLISGATARPPASPAPSHSPVTDVRFRVDAQYAYPCWVGQPPPQLYFSTQTLKFILLTREAVVKTGGRGEVAYENNIYSYQPFVLKRSRTRND